MAKCIFCQLYSGQTPARIVHKTSACFAFLPLHPEVRGHTLVAPVRHISTWPELVPEDVTNLFLAVQEVSALLCSRLSADAVNVLFAGGSDAGQSVPHFHVHVLPRWRNDGVDTWPRLPGYQGDLDVDHRILTQT